MSNKNSPFTARNDQQRSKKFEEMARRKEASSVSVSKHTCAAQPTQQQSQNSNFNERYRVYYEDTDAGGVVYYANYLKFFERARTDFLREVGISQSELATTEKTLFVVRRCEVDYLTPARLDDVVEISVTTKEIRAASILMSQEMRKDEKILAKLEAEIVCVDGVSFKPKKISKELISSLQSSGQN